MHWGPPSHPTWCPDNPYKKLISYKKLIQGGLTILEDESQSERNQHGIPQKQSKREKYKIKGKEKVKPITAEQCGHRGSENGPKTCPGIKHCPSKLRETHRANQRKHIFLKESQDV